MGDQADWIEWGGGECPVEAYEAVEVKFRNGRIHGGRAYAFFWPRLRDDITHDIIAYRVVKL